MSRHAIPYITGDDQTLSPPHTPFLPFTLLPPRITQPTTQPTNPNQNATKPLPFNYPIYLPSIAPPKCHPYPPRPADSLQSKPRARSQEPRAERKTDIYLIYLSIHLPRCAIYLHIHAYTYKYIHIYTYNPIQSNPLQPTSLQPNPIQPNPLPYPTLPPHPSLSPPGFPQSRNPPACKFRR